MRRQVNLIGDKHPQCDLIILPNFMDFKEFYMQFKMDENVEPLVKTISVSQVTIINTEIDKFQFHKIRRDTFGDKLKREVGLLQVFFII